MCFQGESRGVEPEEYDNTEAGRQLALLDSRTMISEHVVDFIADSLDHFIPEIKKGSEKLGPWLDKLQHKVWLLVGMITAVIKDPSGDNLQLYRRMRAEIYRFISEDIGRNRPAHSTTLCYCLQQLDVLDAELAAARAGSG